MRTPVSRQPFMAFFPPYQRVDELPPSATLPSGPFPPRGVALIWNLHGGDWGRGFRIVRDRPPGVALLVLLPPAGAIAGLDRFLELMEHCRPHSILPHMEELCSVELASVLQRLPSNLPVEVVEYLTWRGIEVDHDTRRLIRKTLELSEELRTVSGLARSLYMSRRALGRRFMSRGLPPPSHWLHFGRLLRASTLLQRPGTTLYSVASDMGYPDGFSMSNQMHRLMSLRPSIMKECFGWEWVVEAWLHQEFRIGNLTQELRNLRGPLRAPSLLPELRATGTEPSHRMNVAERRPPAPRSRRARSSS